MQTSLSAFGLPSACLLALAISSALSVTARAADATTAAAAPEQTPARTLATIQVNASKREQNLDSLDAAVSMVGREQLQAAHIATTADLPRVLPGLQINASGSMLFPAITVRGVTSAQDFYNPALSVYIDGVPQLPVTAWQTLLGVEQVELLKGPQGTLYGKSAQGGVLNLVSQQPGDTPQLQLKGGLSNDGGYLLQGLGSGALVDGLLYASLALASHDEPGDLRNAITGHDDQGGARSNAGKLQLRLAPHGAPWELAATASRDCTRSAQDVYVPYDQIRSRTAYVAEGTPAEYADPHMRRCANAQSLSGRYALGDWQLSAVAGLQNVDIARRFALGPYYTQQPEQWQQDVQELRLASVAPGRRWDGVFGLYRQFLDQQRRYINDMPSYGMTALDAASLNRTESLAAYADLTWHASAALDLGAGLRVAHDRARIRFAGSSLDASYALADFSGSGRVSDSRVLGKLSAGYRFAPAWRGYASIAQGYKPAGYNLAPSSSADAEAFDEEQSISYELGLRYQSATLRGNVAVFRTDTDDTQLYRGEAATGMQNLRNVGDSRALGAEFELQWDATAHWTVGLAGQITDAEFRRYDDPVYCADCDGNDVPYVPRHMLSATLQGRLPSPIGRFEPRLALRRTGSQYFDTANSLHQQAYSVLDAALAWQATPNLQLSIYANNLTDRRYRTYAFSNAAMGAYAQAVRGRIVGLTLSYDY
jgi:pesticin/yersiniabactin receptor